MPGKTLRNFWKKTPVTATNVKAPINSKKLLTELAKSKAMTTHALTSLTTALSTYANIVPANDPTCAQRMTALAAIDAECNKWFRNTAVTSLADQPGARAIAKLLKKAEQAHEQLVDATKDDPNVVPFDTSTLPPLEAAARAACWRGIVDGTAQVSVGGTAKFQKKTNAQLAKMLQSATGYNILNYLSAAQNGNPGTNDRIVLGDIIPVDLKTNANLVANDSEVSYALELDPNAAKSLGGGVPVDGTENAAQYPTLARTADLQQAIFAGALGVIVGGKKYTFGTGSGSFVKTVPPRAGDEDSDTAGHGNSEIITPGFVTLAHELGHAVNIRAGATTRDHPELMQALCKAQDPTLSDQRIEDLWSNGEEYFNITNIENGIRADAGLPLRVAHKPRTALRKMEINARLDQRSSAIRAKDNAVGGIAEYADFIQFYNANKGHTDNDQILTQISTRLDRLETSLTDTKIEDWKRNDLRDYRKTLDAVWNAIVPLADTDDKAIEYASIDDELTNDMDTLVAIGTLHWQAIKDRTRNLRFALDKLPKKAG